MPMLGAVDDDSALGGKKLQVGNLLEQADLFGQCVRIGASVLSFDDKTYASAPHSLRTLVLRLVLCSPLKHSYSSVF